MTKRTFHSFSYQKCDSMARYLNHMALSGWHFKKFGIFNSFIFEKGKPDNVCYKTDIFPKGAMSDRVPSKEAKEYAKYWEEAGWKLIDGMGKLCIYKKIQEDAYEFQPPEVKLQQVKTSTIKETLWIFAAALFWICSHLIYALDDPLELADMLFDGQVFLMNVICLGFLLAGMMRIMLLLIRCRKWKAVIESGGIPFYGNEMCEDGRDVVWSDIFTGIVNVLIVLCFLWNPIRNGNYDRFVEYFVLLLIVLGASIVLSVVRPTREQMPIVTVLLIVVACFISIGIMETVDWGNTGFPAQKIDAEGTAFWKEIETEHGEIMNSTVEISETPFGKRLIFEQEYEDGEDDSRCAIITSKSKWVQDLLWKETKKQLEDDEWKDELSYQDATQEWNTEEAYFDGIFYHVRGQGYQIHFFL
ncbi:MAG: DUF2812 domain-containing protein, partial [Lachnospiraceae bacterium]|nr:DUF2812 domain-containing protein [Lachnospiraceae bacterium]